MTDATEKTKQGPDLSAMLWLGISIILTVVSILNLFQGTGGFTWSIVFENLTTAYKALIHQPLDWLSGWINIKIPPNIKDSLVLVVLNILVLNLLYYRETGRSFRANFNEEMSDDSILRRLLGFLAIAFWFPYTAVSGAIAGEEADKPFYILYCKYLFSIVLFAIVLLGVNFAFLGLGL